MLRGIASLSVCMYHFTNGNPNYFSNGYWLKEVGSIGWAGVEIFFVISGFIIPFSLYQSRYRLKKFKTFLIKRVVRIEPPYFLSILLLIALNYLSSLSPYFKGTSFSINYFNLALHIGYLNDFFNQPWLNPVFWTLAIEFQFYILIGLIFPILNHQKIWIFISAIVLLCGCGFLIKSSILIFHYISFFALGILIFKRKTGIYVNKYVWILEPLLLIIIYLQFSLIPFIAASLAWSILFFHENWKNKWILWLGTISYSLYLTHIFFGGKITVWLG